MGWTISYTIMGVNIEKRLKDHKTCNVSFLNKRYLQGEHLPTCKCEKNMLLFVLEGELLFNSYQYPGATLRKGEVVLQPMGSKIEYLALTEVLLVRCEFNDIPLIDEEMYNKLMEEVDAPLTYTPLEMHQQVTDYMHNLVALLDDAHEHIYPFLEMKARELTYLLLRYNDEPQLRKFFFPIQSYTENFQHFVMQNYAKVKNVEEFARLGGYTLSTFRRIFKNVFGQAVYEWILDKKREGIIHDLQYTTEKISLICKTYNFDSLSHFAHFCKSSFGDTPRNLRKRGQAGEDLTLLLQTVKVKKTNSKEDRDED